ncbi:hypothetical protein F5Y18DRAFT_429777 [Xylariaceae sp. FL1019]|nr:hypothetical protein F5Y18DRAFT_429777 [Xylariaceae sp. FL1019]
MTELRQLLLNFANARYPKIAHHERETEREYNEEHKCSGEEEQKVWIDEKDPRYEGITKDLTWWYLDYRYVKGKAEQWTDEQISRCQEALEKRPDIVEILQRFGSDGYEIRFEPTKQSDVEQTMTPTSPRSDRKRLSARIASPRIVTPKHKIMEFRRPSSMSFLRKDRAVRTEDRLVDDVPRPAKYGNPKSNRGQDNNVDRKEAWKLMDKDLKEYAKELDDLEELCYKLEEDFRNMYALADWEANIRQFNSDASSWKYSMPYWELDPGSSKHVYLLLKLSTATTEYMSATLRWDESPSWYSLWQTEREEMSAFIEKARGIMERCTELLGQHEQMVQDGKARRDDRDLRIRFYELIQEFPPPPEESWRSMAENLSLKYSGAPGPAWNGVLLGTLQYMIYYCLKDKSKIFHKVGPYF